MQAKLWTSSTTEPSAWQRSVTNSTAGLGTAGSLGFLLYLSSTATAPVTVHVDNLTGTAL